jgi:hypothetical protein
MFNTINDIIYVAGDSTVDVRGSLDLWFLYFFISSDREHRLQFDWYTKRAVLAGVYTSTELFMLTDASDNFADTWAFLDRRLEDVVTLSKYKAEVPLPCSLLAHVTWMTDAVLGSYVVRNLDVAGPGVPECRCTEAGGGRVAVPPFPSATRHATATCRTGRSLLSISTRRRHPSSSLGRELSSWRN